MTKQIPGRRVVKPATPGAKTLITAASLAATLTGWGMFANHDSLAATQTVQQPTEPSDSLLISVTDLQALPVVEPLPTLVPAPTPLPLSAFAGPTRLPVLSPTPPAQAVVPQAPRQALRVVTAPPVRKRNSTIIQKPAPIKPVASTRSSR